MHQLHIRKLLNLKLELTFYCSRTKDCNHVLIAFIFITVDLFIFVCPVNLLSQDNQKNRPIKNEKEAREQLALIDVDWMFLYCWQRFTKIFRLSLQVAVSVLHRSSSCLQKNNEVNTRAKVLRQQDFCYFSLTQKNDDNKKNK